MTDANFRWTGEARETGVLKGAMTVLNYRNGINQYNPKLKAPEYQEAAGQKRRETGQKSWTTRVRSLRGVSPEVLEEVVDVRGALAREQA